MELKMTKDEAIKKLIVSNVRVALSMRDGSKATDKFVAELLISTARAAGGANAATAQKIALAEAFTA
jgi:hypothetical protein